jgi:hypothetical protein
MTGSPTTLFDQLLVISRAAFDDVRIPTAYYALQAAFQYARDPDEVPWITRVRDELRTQYQMIQGQHAHEVHLNEQQYVDMLSLYEAALQLSTMIIERRTAYPKSETP